MINPAAAMKVMKAKNQFVSNHPKFAAFFRNVLTGGVQEGTVIEITVTRPGEEPMTTNMRVQQSDIELFQNLKDLKADRQKTYRISTSYFLPDYRRGEPVIRYCTRM